MYVVGSSLFIPDIMHGVAGNALFIGGSSMILMCRLWLYSKTKFKFPFIVVANLLFEMGGAASFFIGPAISIAGFDLPSVVFYIIGSVSFISAAIFNLMI